MRGSAGFGSSCRVPLEPIQYGIFFKGGVRQYPPTVPFFRVFHTVPTHPEGFYDEMDTLAVESDLFIG